MSNLTFYNECKKIDPEVKKLWGLGNKTTIYWKNKLSELQNRENVLVFDLKTTGSPPTILLGKCINPSKYNLYNRCRVIEIAYIIHNGDNELVRKSSLIKPNNYKINRTYKHNITTEMTEHNGVNITKILDVLENDIISYNIKKIISHNINFNKNILLSECFRYNKLNVVKLINNMTEYCTLEHGRKYLHQWVYLKLADLYNKLFNANIKQNDQTLRDTLICLECYLKLINL